MRPRTFYAEIIELYKLGIRPVDIARDLGVTINAVNWAIGRHKRRKSEFSKQYMGSRRFK